MKSVWDWKSIILLICIALMMTPMIYISVNKSEMGYVLIIILFACILVAGLVKMYGNLNDQQDCVQDQAVEHMNSVITIIQSDSQDDDPPPYDVVMQSQVYNSLLDSSKDFKNLPMVHRTSPMSI